MKTFRALIQDKLYRKLQGRVYHTAREFGQGDFCAGLKRQETFQAQVHLHKIESDDPIAFMAGYMDAIAGNGKPNDDDLAEGYLAGYRKGVAVKNGEESKPSWIK